ncbi:MAG: DNA repair protein RecO [Lachnospiraceae bacterium]|nr:DNA repair protein RecO [Lachnospiraceae bacterium]
MGQNIILTGMILNVMPIGEYDKRVTILTKERGKITAFARGARRPTSQLLAATSPFSFGEFEVFEGRNTYTLAKASIKNHFRALAADPQTACYGFYFLEMTDYYAQENNDERELLKLLYQTLRALESSSFDNRLVRRIFELRVLFVEGEYPNFFSCQCCGKKEELQWFSNRQRGMLCTKCAHEASDLYMDESTLYTMQYILSARLEKLYTFAVSKEVLERLELVLNRYLSSHISHKFNSLEILRTIAG